MASRYLKVIRYEYNVDLQRAEYEPKEKGKETCILKFKSVRENHGEILENAVQAALDQIEKKRYEAAFLAKGIPAERIRKYGFAFRGKEVLIGTDRPLGERG